MDFSRRRGSIIILFNRVFDIILLILTVLAGVLLSGEIEFENYIYLFVLGVYRPLRNFVKCLNTFYSISDGHLIIESGVFKKTRMEMPIATIATVDLSQNILYQLFRSYKIKIDNLSQSDGADNKPELVLALKEADAIKFKSIILSENQDRVANSDEQYLKIFEGRPLDFIKLGLLQSKLGYILIAGFLFFTTIIAVESFSTGLKSEALMDSFAQKLLAASSFWVVVGVVFLIYIGGSLSSMAMTVISYYGFKVYTDDRTVKVEYGLINKKKYVFSKSKISGVVLKQNLLMRLFKIFSADLLIMGYGDKAEGEDQEEAIIFPVASMSQVKGLISMVLPDLNLEWDLKRPEKKAFMYFFLRPSLIISVIIFTQCIGSVNLSSRILSVYFLILMIVRAILRFYNMGLCCGGGTLVLQEGGYHKHTSIIKAESVENITSGGSLLKRRKGIVSIEVGLVAPKSQSKITVMNLPSEQFEKLGNVLRY